MTKKKYLQVGMLLNEKIRSVTQKKKIKIRSVSKSCLVKKHWFDILSYNHIRNNVLKSNGLRMNNTLTCFNQIYNGILIFLDTANNQGFCSTIHELLADFNLTSKIVIPIPTLIISFAYIMNYLFLFFAKCLCHELEYKSLHFISLPFIYCIF